MISTQTGKDIKTKADEARRDIPSQFLGAPKGNLSDTFETKVAILSGEQEHRNDISRKNYDEDHDERQAARAGVLDGRIRDDMHGDRERRLRQQAEEKRKERAETAMYLAMLQDRINDLDRQAAEYGLKIKDFENRHLTPEEKVTINALPESQRLAATDAAFCRKVVDGTMTQAEYDQWNQWYVDKARVEKDRDHLKEVYQNGTPEQIKEAAEKADINDARSQRNVLTAPQMAMVEQVISDRYEKGTAKRQDVFAAELSDIGQTDDLLDDTPNAASRKSTASEFAPESTLGEGSMIKASDHFGVAAHQTAPSVDAVKVVLDTTPPDKASPLPGSGIGPGATV